MSKKMKVAAIFAAVLLAMTNIAFAQSTENSEQQQRPPYMLGGPGPYGGGGGCCGGGDR